MKKARRVIGVLLAGLALLFLVGPRPDRSERVSFDPAAIGDDPDAYLARSEAAWPDIRDGLQKEILWADPISKSKTPIALVYVHGFSASRVETAPVSENAARALGANLFVTRLAGHGRTGEAMASAKLTDWFDDMAEAIEIGETIGERVILVAASTGGTLSVWAAHRPDLAGRIDGMVLISPNFAIHGAPTWLLNLPWAESLLPMALGQERSFEPRNEQHAHGWTHRYPSRAVFPMAALLKIVEGIDPAGIPIPALFVYSPEDSVVDARRTADIAARWGGAHEILQITDSTDPNNHVIAGDALSPNTTDRVSEAIVEWAMKLAVK